MYTQNQLGQTVDDVKLRTGEENAILTAPAQNMMAGSAYTGGTYTSGAMSSGQYINQELMTNRNQGFISQQPATMMEREYIQPQIIEVQIPEYQHQYNRYQHARDVEFVQPETVYQEEYIVAPEHHHHHVQTIPVQHVHEHVHTAPVERVVNPKNIREADLYQETVAGSRVQANVMGGMPLTRNNIPLQDLGTPYGQGYRRPIHEHYSEHAHQAKAMHAPHTHVLTATDQLVGRAGDNLGMVNEQQDALIHGDPTCGAGLGQNMMGGASSYAGSNIIGQQTYGTGMTQVGSTYSQQTYGTGMMQNVQQVGTTYVQPATTTSYITKQEMIEPSTQFIVQNPEYQSASFAKQHRVPNECRYCRDENDLLPHAEHISRGYFREEYVSAPTTIVEEVVVQQPVIQQPVQSTLTDQKLPFGGTKPGQYMAQEVPVLYGWGAAPSQRLYKSNEVVGVNYAGATVATKVPKLSRRERKHQKQLERDAYKEVNMHKLEQAYQGNVNEKTEFTNNKVFQNVHEPIDSTITENRIH